jgi:hypothetical protein
VLPSEGGGGLDYNRPPRILPHLAPERYRLPGPPEPPGRRPIPLLAALAPMVMGVAMVLFFNSYFYLMFMLLTPLLMAANHVSGRRAARKDFEEKSRTYRLRRASLEEDVRQKVARERQLRTESAPDPAVLGLWGRPRQPAVGTPPWRPGPSGPAGRHRRAAVAAGHRRRGARGQPHLRALDDPRRTGQLRPRRLRGGGPGR